MKSPIYLFWTILLSGCISLHAVGQIWLSHEDIFDEAEEYINANEFIEALPLYLLLEKKDIINPHIAYKIGTCYLNIRGKKSLSIPYLELAAESVSENFQNVFSETNAPLKALLLLGVAYRINGELDKAISTFQDLRSRIDKTDPEFNVIIDMHLERCQNARLLNAFPNEPRTERLPDQINDEFSNYNPVLVDHDSLLFYMEELKFYDALMRVRMVEGIWGMPENITPAIGSDGDHILVGASADGKTIFLYYYEPLRAGELYYTTQEEAGWTKIKPLNENINTVFHETHASVSTDGRTLYFTSNRDGGFGGLDIYKSVLDENNEWGPAQNLGAKINTPFNEETPIINADDEILYFSSQGHLSMGGYDIFYSLRKGENDWRQPINMGAPISTTDDDLFYYPLDEHVSGLMSRIEDNSKAYDIYRYNSMVFANSPRFNVRGKADGVDSTNYTQYSIAVVHTETGDTLNRIRLTPGGNYEALLPAGNFDLILDKGDKILEVAHVELDENSPENTFLAELPKEDATAGDIEKGTEWTDIKTQQEKPEQPVRPDGKPTEYMMLADTLYLKHVLYRFDTYEVAAEYQQYLKEIQQLMQRNPELNFQVEGHTDELGPASYNLELSKKRAEAVVKYMTDHQISAQRFEVIGKGEESPAAINKNPDGSDSPQGRRYNRRVVLVPAVEIDGITLIRVNEIPDTLMIPGAK